MSTAIICIILVLIGIVGVKSYTKRLTSGCCGGSGAKQVKKVKVTDRDLSHYPFCKVLKIDGMSCGNCVNRVENSLNSLDGVWAQVDLAQGEAKVYMKEMKEDQMLKDTVKEAGYIVYKIL